MTDKTWHCNPPSNRSEKVVINWVEGDATVVHNPHLYDHNTMSGFATHEEHLVLCEKLKSGRWNNPLIILEGGKQMNVYFGTVIHDDGENQEVLFEPYAVITDNLKAARKEFFRRAVLECSDLPAEELVVYTLQMSGE